MSNRDGRGFAALAEAFAIFAKYDPDRKGGTNCTHDELWVCDIDPEAVSASDAARLITLGFFVCEDEDVYKSYRWGSC